MSRRQGAHAAADGDGGGAAVDLSPLVTHTFPLDDINDAFDLFSHQRDDVLKVALHPGASREVLASQAGREVDRER